jgi:tyrosyl-tRNA synthetase
MFGKVMSLPDHSLPVYHRLILGWAPARVQMLEDGLASGELHPNDEKMRLAREIVTIFHDADGAQAAQQRWDEVFRNKGVPEEMPEETLDTEERLLDILRRLNMVSSSGEAKRLMKQSGIRLNEEPITDPAASVTLEMLPAVLQVGKRKFVRLVGQ